MTKKSPQKTPAKVKKPAWCEPVRQSLEDIAIEWGRSLSYVEECVRNLMFNHIIVASHGSSGPPIVDHFIFDKKHWPFKGLTTQRVGDRPAVFVHLSKPSDFPNGYTWGPAAEIFIPKDEVRRTKKKGAREANQPNIPLEGHSLELLVCLDISTEIYLKGTFRTQHSHKAQLEEALEKRHADKNLSTGAKERIVSVANKNKSGGPPSFHG